MICRQRSSLLLACPFYSLKTKIYVKNCKSPVAIIRKMLLMKDGSFLCELRAYPIYVKVGEIFFFSFLMLKVLERKKLNLQTG